MFHKRKKKKAQEKTREGRKCAKLQVRERFFTILQNGKKVKVALKAIIIRRDCQSIFLQLCADRMKIN